MSNCNCAQYPFSPHVPCYKICTGRILNYASPYELVTIFHIPENIVARIYDINLDNRAQTLDDYQQYLSPPEFGTLNRICSQLGSNPAAMNWIRREMGTELDTEEREPVQV
ncbi:hypothetical protein [uncultured Chitinophaga sp.]|jgi:hypothetical protein|uniref:hypothetical protein n=1 Tax=uncultured Chitinophaga sp. TaxID=339340 RepID=UPI00261577F4|nr:hypothetical protein [uncultured Chitinophaga sp.]